MQTNNTNNKGISKQEQPPERSIGTWKRVLKIVIGIVLILGALSASSPLRSQCTQSSDMCIGILIGKYTVKVMFFASGVYLLLKGVRGERRV